MSNLISTFQERFGEWLTALGQHLQLSLLTLLVAIFLTIPLAVYLNGHKKSATWVLQVAGIFLYYFYWIYLPLMTLFSLAFTLFSLILFNFILLEPKDLARWLIWIVLVFLSLVNDWKIYACLKFMKKLKLEKNKVNLP